MHTCKGYISGSYRGTKKQKTTGCCITLKTDTHEKRARGCSSITLKWLQQFSLAAWRAPRASSLSRWPSPKGSAVQMGAGCWEREVSHSTCFFYLIFLIQNKIKITSIPRSHTYISLSLSLSGLFGVVFFFWLQAHNVLDLWPVHSLCGLRWKFLRSSKWNWFGVWQGEATIAMQQQVLLFNPMNAIKLENIFLFHTIHITCIF